MKKGEIKMVNMEAFYIFFRSGVYLAHVNLLGVKGVKKLSKSIPLSASERLVNKELGKLKENEEEIAKLRREYRLAQKREEER